MKPVDEKDAVAYRHGTFTAYETGCRCVACTRAYAKRISELRHPRKRGHRVPKFYETIKF